MTFGCYSWIFNMIVDVFNSLLQSKMNLVKENVFKTKIHSCPLAWETKANDFLSNNFLFGIFGIHVLRIIWQPSINTVRLMDPCLQ